jgi:hypothetical protein
MGMHMKCFVGVDRSNLKRSLGALSASWTKVVILIQLVAVVFCLMSTVAEATVSCGYQALEKLPPLARSDLMPMTVLFFRRDFSRADDAILRFRRELEATKPKILASAGEVQAQAFDDAAKIPHYYHQQTGFLVVVDSQFMKNGKPKYNDILLSYKDKKIDTDQLLILDPWLIGESLQTSKPDRAFVQVASTIRPEVLPYLLELSTYLWFDPNLFSIPEFAVYASRVTDEAANGGSLSSHTMSQREEVVVNCLDRRF